MGYTAIHAYWMTITTERRRREVAPIMVYRYWRLDFAAEFTVSVWKKLFQDKLWNRKCWNASRRNTNTAKMSPKNWTGQNVVPHMNNHAGGKTFNTFLLFKNTRNLDIAIRSLVSGSGVYRSNSITLSSSRAGSWACLRPSASELDSVMEIGQRRNHWGVGGCTAPPKKIGRTTPTLYVAAECSARNWV